MIDIARLSFQYPGSDFVLSIAQLSLGIGEKVAVVGPSGSGKTTLLNLISGIIAPQAGELTVAQKNVASMSDSQRRDFRINHIGMVFQQFELVEYLRARENILLPYLINSSLQLSRNVQQHAESLANRVGLEDKLNRYPNKLSQGEQQRVAICRALITEPKLLLADEPTGNLDPANKRKILEILFNECKANQQTLVVVTHDMAILDGFDRTIDFEQFRQSSHNPSGATK